MRSEEEVRRHLADKASEMESLESEERKIAASKHDLRIYIEALRFVSEPSLVSHVPVVPEAPAADAISSVASESKDVEPDEPEAETPSDATDTVVQERHGLKGPAGFPVRPTGEPVPGSTSHKLLIAFRSVGKPMGITDAVVAIGKGADDQKARRDVQSTLSWWSRRGRLFVRTSEGIYGLLEWYDKPEDQTGVIASSEEFPAVKSSPTTSQSALSSNDLRSLLEGASR